MTRRRALALSLLLVGSSIATPRSAPVIPSEGTSEVRMLASATPTGAGQGLSPAPQIVTGPVESNPGGRLQAATLGGASLPAVPRGAGGSPRAVPPVRAASMPAPTAAIGTALVGGYATWYDVPGYVASVPWWRPGQRPVVLRVCAEDCLLVTAVGFCQCGERAGLPTVADLSRAAFARLAPLDRGIVKVTLEWPVNAPATDTD